jgi:hypothetical protein
MLASNELSTQRLAAVTNRAISENQRKFLGPYCIQ